MLGYISPVLSGAVVVKMIRHGKKAIEDNMHIAVTHIYHAPYSL